MLHSVHVLVVDDNKQMRLLLRSLLRAAGIGRVTEVQTAEAAMNTMIMTPVDLILLDWNMAPMDGLSFTRLVRTSPSSPNPYVTILMLTAHTEMSRVAAARDAGVSGFLRKPISPQLLFDRIGQSLAAPRAFVRAESYFGPDRRFGLAPGYAGPYRRAADHGGESFDLDDVRMRRA